MTIQHSRGRSRSAVRFLGTVAALLTLLSCTGRTPGQAKAAPIQPGPLTEIGLSQLGDELITAHAIGTELIVLATNTGRIYLVPRAKPDTPPRLIAQLPSKILEMELSPRRPPARRPSR